MRRADASDTKVVKVMPFNPRYDARSGARTRPPSVYPPDDLRHPAQSRYAVRKDERGNFNFLPPRRLFYDDSKEQITACVDGFSVWLQADSVKDTGRRVPVQDGEQLETLRSVQPEVDRKDRDKLYYMAITFPGYGVLDTALMSSGTKLRSKTPRGTAKFWFERIDELRLWSSNRQQRLQLQERLKATTWQVQCCNCGFCCTPDHDFVAMLAVRDVDLHTCIWWHVLSILQTRPRQPAH